MAVQSFKDLKFPEVLVIIKKKQICLLLWNHDQYTPLTKSYRFIFLIAKNNILEDWLFYKAFTIGYL